LIITKKIHPVQWRSTTTTT